MEKILFEKICVILLCNLVFFAKSLCYRYSSDDIPVFQNPPKTKNEIQRRLFWLEGRLRISPQQDHFLTMLIHAAVCVFIYTGFGANEVSFIAALLFTFNPANNQASVWISGRAYAMAALGMTVALTFPQLVIPALLLTTYYNPGFLAPVAFAGSEYWWIVLILPVFWAFHWSRFKRNVKHKMEMEMFAEDKAIKPQKLILAIKTFGYYTLLALIPFKISFYHSFLQAVSGDGKAKGYSIRDRFFWIGVVFLTGIIAYWLNSPWNVASFGLLWWCVCLAPFCNFMRMSQEIAERYVYLPNVGLMVALAYFITEIFK